MSKRHPNHRLAKIHRNYTVEEAAGLFGVHRNTVRQWIKQGLPVSDTKRPTLILGTDLARFLEARRNKNKRPCGPAEIYCVRCRIPQVPAERMVEYRPLTETMGNLVGLCPSCEGWIFRRASLAKLAQIQGLFDITLPQALKHIGESNPLSVNSDLKQEAESHDNAQRQ